MKHTCKRCGKTLEIMQDGDGIHTCTPNYPWPMDKPIEEIDIFRFNTPELVDYLIERIKIAEAERDRLKKELDLLFPPDGELEEF